MMDGDRVYCAFSGDKCIAASSSLTLAPLSAAFDQLGCSQPEALDQQMANIDSLPHRALSLKATEI